MLPALLLAADLAGTLDVSDRTELRVRGPATAAAPASFDAETDPTARLTLSGKRFTFALTYAPRLTLWDFESDARVVTLLNAGEARLEWRSRHSVLSLDETGSYGGTSYASYALVPGPQGQPPQISAIPKPQIVQIGSSTTTLGSVVTFPRWSMRTSVGYQLGGGTDAAARATLPWETGPFGEANFDFAATRPDHATVKLAVSEQAYSPGPESILVEADGGWRHLWSRLSETRLTLGVSEARLRPPGDGAATFSTYPVIEGVFEHKKAIGQLDVSIGARLGPTVNRLLGYVDQRVGGTVMANHTYHKIATRLMASASQSVPVHSSIATTLVAGELGVAYAATSSVGLDAGMRGFWERISDTGVPFLQGTMFVGVSLRAPKVKF